MRPKKKRRLFEASIDRFLIRFLIKHLPKQLSQLRDEKVQLEDKIHDLELVCIFNSNFSFQIFFFPLFLFSYHQSKIHDMELVRIFNYSFSFHISFVF